MRADTYPVFKQGEEHWPKTIAARSLLMLDVLRGMDAARVRLFSHSPGPNEHQFYLTYLNEELAQQGGAA
jgi:hypothetical protein